jgi:hypothetical protein
MGNLPCDGSWTVIEVVGLVIIPLIIVCRTVVIVTSRMNLTEVSTSAEIKLFGRWTFKAKGAPRIKEKAPEGALVDVTPRKQRSRRLRAREPGSGSSTPDSRVTSGRGGEPSGAAAKSREGSRKG